MISLHRDTCSFFDMLLNCISLSLFHRCLHFSFLVSSCSPYVNTETINHLVKNVVGLPYVNMENKNRLVKNVEVLLFVNTGNINHLVKNVGVLLYVNQSSCPIEFLYFYIRKKRLLLTAKKYFLLLELICRA